MPGKKFPDLTGDGKVTKKDILKARGVPGFQKGGAVKKKKEKEEKPQGLDPLGLMKPKNKIKPFMKSEPLKDLRDEAQIQKLLKRLYKSKKRRWYGFRNWFTSCNQTGNENGKRNEATEKS
jgi:hypothetical protein